jgi:tetraacyldisaccharide 4'-kinase
VTFSYPLYWLLQFLAFPLLLLYLGRRILRNRAYLNGLGERFGRIEPGLPGGIWLHAVSVGEIQTAAGLIRTLARRFPGTPVYVSTTTLAGRALADTRLQGLAARVFYAPLDYRFAVRGVLRALKPALVVVMETEIWPNLYREARRGGARLLVVNGRISDAAIGRYRRLRWFFRAVLKWPDAILAQGPVAQARYLELGAPPERLRDAGNLKYDFDPAATTVAPELDELLTRLDPAAVWIAASTMPPNDMDEPDEDDVVIDAFRRLAAAHRRLLLILVPRRPERFDLAAQKLAAAELNYLRRSRLAPGASIELPGVMLLDTIGELTGLFGRATVVFMGGSIVSRGGHNPLEPAAFGAPVAHGAHMENFAEISADLLAAGAAVRFEQSGDLAPAIDALLRDRDRREAIGALAQQQSAARRGATARAADACAALLGEGLCAPPPPLWRRLLLAPLALAWRTGVQVHRAAARPRRLSVPVISIGNLAMGGSGKTPFTLWLARALRERGRRPGVLMRGYRRGSSEPLALAPGAVAPVEQSGEEAALYLAAGDAAVGVGPGRHANGLALIRNHQTDVLLLDDGFEHWALARDADIVLIDALDPLRGGVFPLGRLREPFSALRRASVVVFTRCRAGRTTAALEALVRRHNPGVPIFRARQTITLPPLPPAPVAAFCALGQPDSFRQSLFEAGVQLAAFTAFPDHHRYSRAELAALARSAPLLLTTEKDLANIDPAVAADLNIRAAPLTMQLEDEPGFLRLLGTLVPTRAALH